MENKEQLSIASQRFVKQICKLYGGVYDDRDLSLQGKDEESKKKAEDLALDRFRKKLLEQDIKLSKGKIRKILITGECWSNERSRAIKALYDQYGDVTIVAALLGLKEAIISVYLPYEKCVYGLKQKSAEAKKTERYRAKKKALEEKEMKRRQRAEEREKKETGAEKDDTKDE